MAVPFKRNAGDCMTKKVQWPDGRCPDSVSPHALAASPIAALAAGEQRAHTGRQLFALRGKHGRWPMKWSTIVKSTRPDLSLSQTAVYASDSDARSSALRCGSAAANSPRLFFARVEGVPNAFLLRAAARLRRLSRFPTLPPLASRHRAPHSSPPPGRP